MHPGNDDGIEQSEHLKQSDMKFRLTIFSQNIYRNHICQRMEMKEISNPFRMFHNQLDTRSAVEFIGIQPVSQTGTAG